MNINKNILFYNTSKKGISFDEVADKIVDWINQQPDKDYFRTNARIHHHETAAHNSVYR